MKQLIRMLVCGAAFAALSACGGAGSDVAYIPPPPPAPKPPPPPPPPTPQAADVHIFDNPATQEFAVMSDPSNPGFRMRYDSAAQAYEVASDDYDWTALLPGYQANYYDIGSGGRWVTISQIYQYSALAYWDWWDVAIGSATAIHDGSPPQDLGVLAFKDTVFSPGATQFSGAFDTSVSGPNSFSGRFTGPNAEELIGNWAIPFVWDYDQQAHWAVGAMMAKR